MGPEVDTWVYCGRGGVDWNFGSGVGRYWLKGLGIIVILYIWRCFVFLYWVTPFQFSELGG